MTQSRHKEYPELRLEAHPAYRTPCTPADLRAALGKNRAKVVQSFYSEPMTMADLIMEQAIDAGHLMVLDGAWGPKELPVPVAASFGLHLTDQVISNAVTRGLMAQDEAEAVYVTKGRPRESWIGICDAASLRHQHQTRIFVLSEHPELFGLDTLWEIGYAIGELSLGTSPESLGRRTTAEVAARQIVAPFTDEQVAAIRYWQEHDQPVRCGQAECAATDPHVLSVSREGLTCPACGRVRSWAWRVMTEEPSHG